MILVLLWNDKVFIHYTASSIAELMVRFWISNEIIQMWCRCCAKIDMFHQLLEPTMTSLSDFLWHSPESNFRANTQAIILYIEFGYHILKLRLHYPNGLRVKHSLYGFGTSSERLLVKFDGLERVIDEELPITNIRWFWSSRLKVVLTKTLSTKHTVCTNKKKHKKKTTVNYLTGEMWQWCFDWTIPEQSQTESLNFLNVSSSILNDVSSPLEII